MLTIETTADHPAPADELFLSWKEKLLQRIGQEKLYQDPDLTLTEVARKSGSNPSFISRVVNRGSGLNFNDFINRFRITAVKEMLQKGEHRKQTLLAIAYECGFNSKATFNRAFKKETGLSPREYLSRLNNSYTKE